MKNELALRPYYAASVSGGKDSLYMLGLILNNLDKYPLDAVFHMELEIDYPFVKNVVARMKKLCSSSNIPFISIKPRQSFEELYAKRGFPSRKVRWCNSQYKKDAMRQFEEILKSKGLYSVCYIGFCADETKRFKYEIGKIQEGQRVIYPLAEEGIIESDILAWAKDNPIFEGFYKVNERQGCMYCPMLQYKEMAYQMIVYPEHAQRYWAMVLNEWREHGWNCLRGDKYTPDYIYERVKNYYVPKVREELGFYVK